MELSFRVYMNQRDVTPWITSIEIEHPRRTLYRQWTFNFAAWSNLESGARWDLFATYDDAEPRAEIMSRGGILPPDRERRRLIVAAASVPRLQVRGYDFAWMAQRRQPAETIILVPSSAYKVEERDGRPILIENSVAGAINRYQGPIGKYRVWTHTRTLHQAIQKLGRAAGVNTRILIPNHDLIPTVIEPTKSFWQAIVDLVAPWAPRIYYRDSTNTLVFVDPLARHYGIDRTLELPSESIAEMVGAPVEFKRIRRILARIPKWR